MIIDHLQALKAMLHYLMKYLCRRAVCSWSK